MNKIQDILDKIYNDKNINKNEFRFISENLIVFEPYIKKYKSIPEQFVYTQSYSFLFIETIKSRSLNIEKFIFNNKNHWHCKIKNFKHYLINSMNFNHE